MDPSLIGTWKGITSNIYSKLPNEKSQVMYIWIDGTQQYLRAKTRIFDTAPKSAQDLPEWTYCGYGTYQAANAIDSELVLKPCALYPDPFRPGPNNKLVLCDTYVYGGPDKTQLIPHSSNKRFGCSKEMERVDEEDYWFGLEQEYAFLNYNQHPVGWPELGYPSPMGPYYCGVGAGRAIARDLLEAHLSTMLYCGIGVHGTNAEAMPSQWEYQLAPLSGLDACDQMWMARFLLHRLGEEYGVVVSFDPKPITGNWSGSGVHVNISTRAMREDGGLKAIEDAVSRLADRHSYHISQYDPNGGLDNARRLTGLHETAHIDTFSSGRGDRTVSVRIPKEVVEKGKGYLEDRRPSSNCDPYQVITALVETISPDKTTTNSSADNNDNDE